MEAAPRLRQVGVGAIASGPTLTTLPVKPVRRSARLAGLTHRVRRSSLPAPHSPKEQEPPPNKLGTVPEVHSTLVKGTGLNMKLAIRPPRGIVAGARFRDPLIVTFISEKAAKDDETFGSDWPDLSAAFVWLSLMSEDESENLKPHDKDVLTGRKADSVHLINGNQEGDEQMVAYAVFRDLAIQTPGRYCFAFHLIDFAMYDKHQVLCMLTLTTVSQDRYDQSPGWAKNSFSHPIGVFPSQNECA